LWFVCIAFLTTKLEAKDFMILAAMVFTYYVQSNTLTR
jgi:hypothetical protein